MRTEIDSVRFGRVAILWKSQDACPRIAEIELSASDVSADVRIGARNSTPVAAIPQEIETLCSQIEAYLNGEPVEFSLHNLAMERCSPFQKSVLRTVHRIPYGSTCGYREVAVELNKPRSVRAVGNALAHNPFPIIMPCHRVIRSDGSLGGYGGGMAMKRRLLAMEGVYF